MQAQLEKLRLNALKTITATNRRSDLEQFRHSILGRKGVLTLILKQIKNFSIQEKKILGKMANDLKKELETAFLQQLETISQKEYTMPDKKILDITIPGHKKLIGRIHPITKFIQEIEDTFIALNFNVVEGPIVEDDYHNFTALNIPKDHPARDTQDTFWIQDVPLLLRTQTSSVQIRYMETHRPPFRIICPGRVFRRDEMDATHSPMFHQFEGLMIDTSTNLSNLKGILTITLRRLIHSQIELRFRSSFFPFVEPGLEVDITCVLCKGKGCALCKKSGWIEMLGCGMVHPYVLKAVGIDPNVYQGFAFGAGIERLLMMKYEINDIRLFFENDPRFLEQFPMIS